MAKLWVESHSEGKGRIVVAAEDIPAGDIVLEDECMVAAPDGVPVCLGCLGALASEGDHACSWCGWPMCCDNCARSRSAEHESECEIFSSAKIKPDSRLWYSIVPLLRILLLKRDNPVLYDKTVVRFESHWNIRKLQPEVANLLRYRMLLNDVNGDHDSESCSDILEQS